MEAAVTALRAAEDQDFLRTTTAALKVVQNILNEASEEKYRRLRSTVGVRTRGGGRAGGADVVNYTMCVVNRIPSIDCVFASHTECMAARTNCDSV